MKIKTYTVLLLFILLAACLYACGSKENGESDLGQFEISYYDQLNYRADAYYSDIGNDLFFRNDFTTACADPFILQITDPFSEDYGKFYLYGTNMLCFKSSDMQNWDKAGYSGVFMYVPDISTDVGRATATLNWAPAVTYDESDGYYYAFFSASEENERIYLSYCARSQNPGGPFEIVSNAKYETTRTTYSTKIGDAYSLLNQDELIAWAKEEGLLWENPLYQNHLRTIDFHPFLDPVSGNKYLYFKIQACYRVGNKIMDAIVGVQMETWTKPLYDTLTVLAVAGYYEVDCEEENPWENGTQTNEGPWVSYHKNASGKDVYYLTLSTFGYSDVKYAVWQAVSEGPLTPFRKLTYEEGGLLYSPDGGTRTDIYATGHHALIEIDGKTYIMSHSYLDSDREGPRYVVCDEIEWITIKDKNGNDLDVMYANGPTTAIQSKFEFASEYKNIALDADVSATNLTAESKAGWLNDGLIRMNIPGSSNRWTAFADAYVREAQFDNTATITLNFKDYKCVRALMIYNSIDIFTAFASVKKIEMDAKLANGKTFTALINDLAFDSEANTTEIGEMLPGAAAIAEFAEMMVKTIRITIEIPEDKDTIGISEIKILGKDDTSSITAESVATYFEDYSPVPPESRTEDYTLNEGITIDGKFDEIIWKSLTWETYTVKKGTETVTLKMTSHLGAEGVYFAVTTDEKTVYFNRTAPVYHASSFELYLSRAGVTNRSGAGFCLSFDVGGRFVIRQANYLGFVEYYSSGRSPKYAVCLNGLYNVVNGSKGYSIEFYVPYEVLGLSEKPDYVMASPTINFQYSPYCRLSSRTRYRWGDDAHTGWTEVNPSSWSSWAEGVVTRRE